MSDDDPKTTPATSAASSSTPSTTTTAGSTSTPLKSSSPSSSKPSSTGKPAPKDWSIPPRPRTPTTRPGARAEAEHRKWKRIEWVWTLVPIFLLAAVAIPSVGLLYSLDTGPTAYGVSPNYYIDVIGQQWLWSFKYDSAHAVAGEALPANATDTSVLYVPQNAVVWINVTSLDVIHDFNVPALGVRIDAIPGTTNHYWFTIPKGTVPWTEFLIQCTEFCGQGHYAMRTELVVTPATSEI